MPFSLHRFVEFGGLSASEADAVKALGGPPVQYQRGSTIRREGTAASEFYILHDGWVLSCATLPDGGRQVMKVHLPGDALGTPSMCLDHAAETLTAVTPVSVSAVPFERFGALFVDHPRVAAYMMLSAQRERVALMDWLASIGRTSAEARLAALLLDLATRLEPLGLVRNHRFRLMLTQEQIGDALGLTSVHVNRMFRELETQDLIVRDSQGVTIRDPARLHRLAALPVRRLRTKLNWLPPAR